MSGWDRAVDAAKSAELGAEIAFTIAGSAFAPAADMPNSYQTTNPTETAVVAAAEMIGAKVDGEKISDDMDLEGVREAEAEYAETSPPSEDSTFAATAEAEAAASGEGDNFAADDALDTAEAADAEAGEGDAFAADDALDTAEAADSEAGDGDAFASENGDMSDAADVDGDASDSDGDTGSDGDAGGDGADGGW